VDVYPSLIPQNHGSVAQILILNFLYTLYKIYYLFLTQEYKYNTWKKFKII